MISEDKFEVAYKHILDDYDLAFAETLSSISKILGKDFQTKMLIYHKSGDAAISYLTGELQKATLGKDNLIMYYIAYCYICRDDMESALSWLKRCLQTSKGLGFPEPLHMMSYIYLKTENMPECLSYLQKTLSEDLVGQTEAMKNKIFNGDYTPIADPPCVLAAHSTLDTIYYIYHKRIGKFKVCRRKRMETRDRFLKTSSSRRMFCCRSLFIYCSSVNLLFGSNFIDLGAKNELYLCNHYWNRNSFDRHQILFSACHRIFGNFADLDHNHISTANQNAECCSGGTMLNNFSFNVFGCFPSLGSIARILWTFWNSVRI